MIRLFVLMLGAILLPGCATQTGQQCQDNFKTSGSIFSGKSFSTTADLPMTPAPAAFDKAYKALLREGFRIESSDAQRGAISAYQNVNFSNKTAPLNLLVEPLGQGSRLTFVFVASGGLYTPEAGARDYFCELVAQVR
jgi:hypothetical protein